MVDYIIAIQKCGIDAVKSNAIVNTFMKLNKMQMGHRICQKVHCGEKSFSCPDLKVHKQTMLSSDQENYLGDHVTSSANYVKTISKLKAQGYGIITDFRYLLEAIPNAKHRTKVVLELRQAWFLNSVLLYMESRHNLLRHHLKKIKY